MKSALTGMVYSWSSSGEPSRRRFSTPPPIPLCFRLPRMGEEYSSCRKASSRDFLTVRPARVRERTISKARKPTISTVSSLALRSRWGGRLRNSRKRFAGEEGGSVCPKTNGDSFTFTISERRLSAIRVVLIFLASHLSGSIISFLRESLATAMG